MQNLCFNKLYVYRFFLYIIKNLKHVLFVLFIEYKLLYPQDSQFLMLEAEYGGQYAHKDSKDHPGNGKGEGKFINVIANGHIFARYA